MYLNALLIRDRLLNRGLGSCLVTTVIPFMTRCWSSNWGGMFCCCNITCSCKGKEREERTGNGLWQSLLRIKIAGSGTKLGVLSLLCRYHQVWIKQGMRSLRTELRGSSHKRRSVTQKQKALAYLIVALGGERHEKFAQYLSASFLAPESAGPGESHISWQCQEQKEAPIAFGAALIPLALGHPRCFQG